MTATLFWVLVFPLVDPGLRLRRGMPQDAGVVAAALSGQHGGRGLAGDGEMVGVQPVGPAQVDMLAG